MKNLRNRYPARSLHGQRGAVLIIGMILLLVMTLIGVGSMRSAALEERMTGNLQDHNVALQAAEAALRAGEQIVQQPVLPAFDGSNGLYPPPNPTADPRWTTVDWSTNQVRGYNGFAGAPGSLPNRLENAAAGFFVEEMPQVAGPGESLASDTPVGETGFYRISAQGVGISGNAIVFLQTTYKR